MCALNLHVVYFNIYTRACDSWFFVTALPFTTSYILAHYNHCRISVTADLVNMLPVMVMINCKVVSIWSLCMKLIQLHCYSHFCSIQPRNQSCQIGNHVIFKICTVGLYQFTCNQHLWTSECYWFGFSWFKLWTLLKSSQSLKNQFETTMLDT